MARKLVLVLYTVVVPALQELLLQQQQQQQYVNHLATTSSTDEEPPNPLMELFADEAWKVLLDVARAIPKGGSLDFVTPELCLAWQRAVERYPTKAIPGTTHGVDDKDDDLDGSSVLVPIMAEYHAQLCPTTGQLRPTLLEIIGRPTRRVFRVLPMVRDRFLLVSNVDFGITTTLLPATGWILGGRRYQYLLDKGAGKPTLWLYAAISTLSRNELLMSLGDFSTVPSTKLGDRLALAFTQTTPICHLSLDQIEGIPEIVHNDFIFSDGVGVMGTGIAQRIQECMNLPKLPGAVLIRMGGVKGMMSLKKDFPPFKVGIRPSMVKFSSSHTVLEVKRVAKANSSPENKLFNQSILNLYHLMDPQTRNRVFIDLQAKACAEMAYEFDPKGQEELLAAGDNLEEYMRYTQRVIARAKKYSGEKFTVQEYQAIMKKMNAARAKGPVWICRSPCTAPGDIQRAYAMPRRRKEPFTVLDDVLIFSARGERPLPDMLAGGDLDGDEYYVITEPRLIGMLNSARPQDYGSQKSNIPSHIDVQEKFSVDPNANVPSLDDQLEVFHQYIARGDMVSKTADAWIRVADREGPSSPDSLALAELCQQALDARKLATGFDPTKLQVMQNVLNKYSQPFWKRGGGKDQRIMNAEHISILGILYCKWVNMINAMIKTEGRVYNRPQTTLEEDASQYLETQSVTSTVASTTNQCVICLAVADMKCPQCDAWYCCISCKEYHGEEAGHSWTRTNRESLIYGVAESNTIEFGEFEVHINDNGVLNAQRDARNALTDIVFGRSRPPLPQEKLRFESLDENDIRLLASMVGVEFFAGLKAAEEGGHSEGSIPHVDDVFLAKPGHNVRYGEKLICRRVEGDLYFVDKNNQFVDLDQGDFRVASIAGASRILENLIRPPLPSTMMHWAMKREMLVDIVEQVPELLHPYCRSLNESQRKVVATATDESFEEGFLAVHAPPGTGKTTTAVGIAIAIGGGVIVTAPSNAAVANVALALFRSNYFRREEIVVWGDGCDESVRFLNPRSRYDRYQSFRKFYDESDDEESKAQKLFSLASWLKLNRSQANVEVISGICQLQVDPFASAKVLLCTLNTSGSSLLRKSARFRFDLLILDEAGQCPEAEFYIATTFPGVNRIVLLGDPHQLPATVISQECQEAGYGESFLSHVLEFYPDKVHMLNHQYRSDPCILHLYNNLFYGGRIQSDSTVHGRKPGVSLPLKFVDTSGMGNETRSRHSWVNDYELVAVSSMLANDPDIQLLLEKSESAPRVIIISPYSAQVEQFKKMLEKFNSINLEVGTVDGFQGQEADIVILSTVRTRAVGFVDDARRLNVALSRAKRILRIICDINFFKSLDEDTSILRNLASYALRKSLSDVIPLNKLAWKPPDWSTVTMWRPTMTARFHNCLKDMGRMHKNLAFNTLLAVAQPRLSDLEPSNTQSRFPRWHKSSLRKSEHVQIVWIAKEYEWVDGKSVHYVGTVEVHFTGTRDECLRFMQLHNKVPPGACRVDYSWLVTDDIQQAVMNDQLDHLPEGLFALDQQQEKVLEAKLPLLLESLVCSHHEFTILLGIALGHWENKCPLPARCCVCEKLIAGDHRQTHLFHHCLSKFKDRAGATLQRGARKNEIGGVILGSLEAALSREPLTRIQYLSENRSNVPIDTEQGQNNRSTIYAEYELYRKWKIEKAKYDVHDVVLELIRSGLEDELFRSIYLDEIQDFSYSSIYLICSVGGRVNRHWVAAGDTAQMISPGCSFTFDGMKQVLRAIDRETELHKVVKLQRNYRMTKGVLEVGNAVLALLKKYFPSAIDSIEPKEIAMKDLGLRVVLCDWDNAMNEPVSFGVQQAVVLSSPRNETRLTSSIADWLRNHPFILTALDSKGLEFDDVVVAFDVERPAWLVHSGNAASLRLLRELYVAITRAKRRVVILTKKSNKVVREFFHNLNAGVEDTDSSILALEFDKQTTEQEWFDRGIELLKERKYKLAASCLISAGQLGWANQAQGNVYLELGQKDTAKEYFQNAAHIFFESSDFEHCLDTMKDIAALPPWDTKLNGLFQKALAEKPNYLPRVETIKFAILCGSWESVKPSDLFNGALVDFFENYRSDDRLKSIVRICTEKERKAIEASLPNLVGDFFFEEGVDYTACVRLYIKGGDFKMAADATRIELEKIKDSEKYDSWKHLYAPWIANPPALVFAKKQPRPVSLFVDLFHDPKTIASRRGTANNCLNALGREAVKAAINYHGLGIEGLHMFDRAAFELDIRGELVSRYTNDLIGVVHWYLDHDDKQRALRFAEERLGDWPEHDFLRTILHLRPSSLVDELERRNLFGPAVRVFLQHDHFDIQLSEEISNRLLVANVQPSDAKEILHYWRDARTNNSRVRSLLSKKVQQTPIVLLFQLFENPTEAAKRNGKRCMTLFGKAIVREAVDSAGPYEGGNYSVLCLFDDNEFEEYKRPSVSRRISSGAQNSRQSNNTPLSSVSGTFPTGSRVRIRSLQSTDGKKLNGKVGTVLSFDKKSGRHSVQLATGDKPKGIKGTNLELLEGYSSDSDNDIQDLSTGLQRKSLDSSNGTTGSSLTPRRTFRDDDLPGNGRRRSNSSSSDDGSMPGLWDPDHSSSSSVSADDSDDESSLEGLPDLQERRELSSSSESE
eukprot:scaffold3784_cov174-Amphora_coffeaeformis.AAC.3